MMITRLTTNASTGRRMKRSVKDFIDGSGVARFRRGLQIWRELVVHLHRHLVAQFEGAGGNDFETGIEAFGDRHEIAARLAEPDELLANDQLLRVGFGVLFLLDD